MCFKRSKLKEFMRCPYHSFWDTMVFSREWPITTDSERGLFYEALVITGPSRQDALGMKVPPLFLQCEVSVFQVSSSPLRLLELKEDDATLSALPASTSACGREFDLPRACVHSSALSCKELLKGTCQGVKVTRTRKSDLGLLRTY